MPKDGGQVQLSYTWPQNFGAKRWMSRAIFLHLARVGGSKLQLLASKVGSRM
jgi:hypothetical protein